MYYKEVYHVPIFNPQKLISEDSLIITIINIYRTYISLKTASKTSLEDLYKGIHSLTYNKIILKSDRVTLSVYFLMAKLLLNFMKQKTDKAYLPFARLYLV